MPKGKKRGNGEGWINQRKDGRWAAGISYWTPNGLKRKESTKRTHADAVAWLEETKRLVGSFDLSSKNPRLADYMNDWLEGTVKGSVSVRTHRFYRSIMNRHILPSLGHLKLRSITPMHVQNLYAAKRDEGLAVQTRRHIHTTFGKAMKQAVAWRQIPSNPTGFASVPKMKTNKAGITPFTTDELERIKAAAQQHRIPALYTFAPATGLRPQEVCALTWSDLHLPDRGKGLVRVSRAVVQGERGYEIGPVKTPNGKRSVDISEQMVALMKRHRRDLAVEELKARTWKPNEFVFPNSRGGFMDRHVLSRYFVPIRKAAKLEGHTFKDFRHTFATLLFQRGRHPKEVQMLMGHSDIRVTMDTYSHYIPNMHAGASEALEDIF